MKQRTRIISAMLCIAMVLSVILSTAFIITSVDHKCTGDDCEICYQIHICKQTLKKLALGISGLLRMLVVGIASVIIPIFSQNVRSSKANTLISMKVKLSC